MAKSRPKHFEYWFEEADSVNVNAPVRIKVLKYAHQDTVGSRPTQDIKALNEYSVYGSSEDGFVCTCPSSLYQAEHGRCKHVVLAEEWIELREENFKQRDFYFSTINEKFSEVFDSE